jgi:VIT1/CCC1 family predicted Fe2+/Mn2+ transporter
VSSHVVGVAAADPAPRSVLIAGVAGLAAGAMSMAAGEYVSVSSQSDTERADIRREETALAEMPEEGLCCTNRLMAEVALSPDGLIPRLL